MTKEDAYDILIEYGVATQGEVDLVTNINGFNPKALLDILWARTGAYDFKEWAHFDMNGLDEDLEEAGYEDLDIVED